ncbi:MAG: hypothetical protein O3A63_16720 [Proteobacteria bacterium]|nr:hypothetical protein [Pseudomonadota bacterium]
MQVNRWQNGVSLSSPLASVHYSFMGAGLAPEAFEHSVEQLAGMLKKDRVDTVFLTPV